VKELYCESVHCCETTWTTTTIRQGYSRMTNGVLKRKRKDPTFRVNPTKLCVGTTHTSHLYQTIDKLVVNRIKSKKWYNPLRAVVVCSGPCGTMEYYTTKQSSRRREKLNFCQMNYWQYSNNHLYVTFFSNLSCWK
jgi:hypothetical protein